MIFPHWLYIKIKERQIWKRAFMLYHDATFREYTRSARAYYAGERFTFTSGRA
jgi:hypothetical protein